LGKIIMARAPVRNADLGGWRDTRLFESGNVLNIAIRLYTYVCLIPTEEEGVEIISHDMGDTEYVRNVRDMEYAGALGLMKAAVGSSGTKGGFKLVVRSEAPPASGLGSSAALAVSMLGALYYYEGKKMLPHQIAANAQRIETDLLNLECGVQDQLASAFGGINFIEVDYPNARVTPVPVSDATLCELETDMLVVYTGKSHFSSATHKHVIENFEKDDQGVLAAFDGLNTTAGKGVDALMRSDIAGYADALNDNWEFQKRLHETITTPEVEDLHQRACKLGCIGFKLNGAGAGGTAVMICARNTQRPILEMIKDQFPQMIAYRAKIDIGRCQGLQVWAANE
jgi:D-glycero-alpha-D-manno-heptose-7-phosphate kinase